MRPPKSFPEGTADRMKVLLRQTKSLDDHRRIQAVLMRASGTSSPALIAGVTGLSLNTVRIIHSRFLREGEGFLVNRAGRGGRRRALLSVAQRERLLDGFREKAAVGGVVEASSIKRAYEKAVGHPVALTSVYRLLAAEGWRKIVPRPSHPKKNPESESAFKKSSRKS
jgi:transposase